MALQVRDLYRQGVKNARLPEVAEKLIHHVMAGDDRGLNLEESLRTDRFFTRQILSAASAKLKKGEVKDLSHAVVLLGPEIVRDFVLGHTVYRIAEPDADSKFESYEKSSGYAPRMKAMEEFAKKVGYDSVGTAMAVGLLFDQLERKIRSNLELDAQLGTLLDRSWNHALRTGSLAWGIASHEKIQVKLKKMVFPGGLLHDVGTLFLAGYAPKEYLALVPKFEAAKSTSPDDDTPQIQIEMEAFGLSHTEIGSWLVHQTHILADYESLVDFHHDIAVMKTRNPEQFIVALIILIADRVSFLLESKSQVEVRDFEKILESHKQNFPLTATELLNLTMGLRSKGLMP